MYRDCSLKKLGDSQGITIFTLCAWFKCHYGITRYSLRVYCAWFESYYYCIDIVFRWMLCVVRVVLLHWYYIPVVTVRGSSGIIALLCIPWRVCESGVFFAVHRDWQSVHVKACQTSYGRQDQSYSVFCMPQFSLSIDQIVHQGANLNDQKWTLVYEWWTKYDSGPTARRLSVAGAHVLFLSWVLLRIPHLELSVKHKLRFSNTFCSVEYVRFWYGTTESSVPTIPFRPARTELGPVSSRHFLEDGTWFRPVPCRRFF